MCVTESDLWFFRQKEAQRRLSALLHHPPPPSSPHMLTHSFSSASPAAPALSYECPSRGHDPWIHRRWWHNDEQRSATTPWRSTPRWDDRHSCCRSPSPPPTHKTNKSRISRTKTHKSRNPQRDLGLMMHWRESADSPADTVRINVLYLLDTTLGTKLT